MGKLKTPTENWYAPDILPKAAAQTVQVFNVLCTITKVRNQGPTTDAGTSTGRKHCESFSPPISCTPSLNSKMIVPPSKCVSAVVGVPAEATLTPLADIKTCSLRCVGSSRACLIVFDCKIYRDFSQIRMLRAFNLSRLGPKQFPRGGRILLSLLVNDYWYSRRAIFAEDLG